MATRRSNVGGTWRKTKETLTDAGEVGSRAQHTHHVEEGDEGLVAGLDEQDTERVVIEGNPLQCPRDRVQDGSTSNCGLSDATK